jgi:uncharacterized protein (DUF1800 family)
MRILQPPGKKAVACHGEGGANVFNAPPKHRTVAALLLCLMLLPPGLRAQSTSVPHPADLDLDQRILHVLNRFTFGLTQEDIIAVRKAGIDAWFEQQLHPASIPDNQLESRLDQFPALLLSVDRLMERFPSNAIIRQISNGKLAVPNDPYLSPIYTRQIDLYEDKQAKKAEANTDLAKLDASKPEMSIPAETAVSGMTKVEPVAQFDLIRNRKSATARPSYDDVLVKTVLALPPTERVRRILAMHPAEYEQLRSSRKGPQKLLITQDMTPSQRELVEDFDNPTRTVVQELQEQRLLRDIYSSRQLQEVMTTFWLNHFNVYLHKNQETPYYLVSYERDVIRPRALGNFEDLLVATAESPAMLLYLDNSTSTGPDSIAAEKQKQRAALGKAAKATPPGLNENYARELMELHTLGVNGGYTQKDITEVAKVFTGWTVDKQARGGGFKFDETRHEPGKKLVLGKKIKEKGQKEGLQLLHMLATSPATAHFISQELAIAFVSDTPPPALVNRMAKTFSSSHGDIAAVLKTMLHSPEFWSPETYQAKVKTPLEYVVSSARASGAEITNAQPLVNALNQMGMPLYACVPPTGYSDKAEEWVSTGALVTRMNFALSLATNHFQGIKADWLPAQLENSGPNQSEQFLETRLIPAGVSQQTRTAVIDQATGTSPNQPGNASNPPIAAKALNPAAQQAAIERQNAQLAGLLLGSPEFQRR